MKHSVSSDGNKISDLSISNNDVISSLKVGYKNDFIHTVKYSPKESWYKSIETDLRQGPWFQKVNLNRYDIMNTIRYTLINIYTTYKYILHINAYRTLYPGQIGTLHHYLILECLDYELFRKLLYIIN